MMMRWMQIALLCVLLCGCDEKKDFSGTVEVKKINGVATNVVVTLPQSGRISFDLDKREDVNALILSLETIVVDLKAAREELPMSQIKYTDSTPLEESQ